MPENVPVYKDVEARQLFTASGFTGFFIKCGGKLFELLKHDERDVRVLRLQLSKEKIPDNTPVAGAPLCLIRPVERFTLESEYVPGKELALTMGTCKCGALCKKPVLRK